MAGQDQAERRCNSRGHVHLSPVSSCRGLARSRRLKTPAICDESADNEKHTGNAGTHGKLRVSTRDHAQVEGATKSTEPLKLSVAPIGRVCRMIVTGWFLVNSSGDLAGILVDVLGPSCPAASGARPGTIDVEESKSPRRNI